ncbi:flagellar hook-associated protein FlgK [Tabrizicola sp. J26]|uniref:flagellar hook-associated protein FlgK n=1 Tax=Alitabrizicola rongguiensis TaxID=2909234 RepID=UPI001F3D6563|nr:flagellar hook-associated protein FlgK [Tabrizicola rongguiensis]MCF1710619.1 flagellar hook-associated protein FlgK [Tabrizicola rongguiensis]
MSLSLGLSNALSGLTANSRATELVSSNIANALTEGYARREIQLSARGISASGQGVTVAGVLRVSDSVLISDRRAAEANAAGATEIGGFQQAIEDALGTPEDEGSIGAASSSLSVALMEAAASPDSTAMLDSVLRASQDLAAKFRAVSGELQGQRERADDRIAASVDQLNTTLSQIDDLNAQIVRLTSADRDASGLMDQRQRLVDSVAEIVPLREIQRDNGEIALVSTGGAVLLDGRPAVFGFVPAGTITADMSHSTGALSGLTLNGKAITPGIGSNRLDGGTLAADFAIRDTLAPAYLVRLDAVALDLVERLSDPGVDPTLGGGARLFTDAGGLVSSTTGLAGRLAVNRSVDPEAGGALWRLREGSGAASESSAGMSSLLSRLNAALKQTVAPSDPAAGTASRSFDGLLSDLVSNVSLQRVRAEDAESYASARYSALRQDELEQGVDSDAEVQALMVIEQAYAANAKVISTIDELLKTLLEM